jgi:urea carboxylase
VDAWIETGSEVPPYYDPMLAKLIAHAATREAAIAQLDAALAETVVYGIETNRDYLRALLHEPQFSAAALTTRWLDAVAFSSATIEVLQPGTQTTVQDWPGRLRHWDVGVPPSGPMDALAFRLANRLLGNAEDCAALELTVTGPTLKFSCDARIALTGAPMRAELDGAPLEYWHSAAVQAGSTLKLGSIEGAGQRTYLAVQGGFDVPRYMDSRATFTLGQFGGHAGRALRTGDVLRIGAARTEAPAMGLSLPPALRPAYSDRCSGLFYRTGH